MRNKLKKLVAVILPAFASIIPLKTFAFCPVCVVATGAGVGILRWLGVDDTISGLWIGGFTLSASLALNNFLLVRNKKIKYQLLLILLVFYAMAILALYWKFGFSDPFNQIIGINKIILGLIAGTILIIFSPYIDKGLRKSNEGKIFISHQKVLIALILLLVSSMMLYFITK